MSAGPEPYAELQCQSAFSFLRGASEPERLVERAAELGYRALALTDRDGLSGQPRLLLAARAAGLTAIHGLTATLASPAGRAPPPRDGLDGSPTGAQDRVVLLAQDGSGWTSLCRLVTAAKRDTRDAPLVTTETLAAHSEGLLALIGPHLPESTVAELVAIFGRERAWLAIHDRLLHRDRRGQVLAHERSLRYGLLRVVTGGVRFARREDKPLHDVLACVRHRCTLDEAATRLLPNAEFCLRPVAELARLFRHDLPALRRSVEIAERCSFSLEQLAYRFPPCAVPAGETPDSHLRRLVVAGARRRYRPLHDAARRQLVHELAVVQRLGMAGYFLLVTEITACCEERGILCQGRGSAANSAICFVLGITSVDPVGAGLLFERFLSENRSELPDIDLDIEHERREEVLQWVYARHGRGHAALAGAIVTWRPRSAVRDAGAALGFTPAETAALAAGIDRRWDNDAGLLPAAWVARGGDSPVDPRLPHLLALVAGLCGLPRHISTHVGGMIITGPPLTEVMPVEPAARAGRTIVPWDKDDLAALGILKIDLLGLGMLAVLRRALALVSAHERPGRPPLALHDVPADDPATWDMLCAADTVGVFQVESRAQMNCLPRLRPRRFYDLVVEVALIRPGPIQGDMVHPYLRRRAGREAVDYAHPSLRPILERTLGVPLFQEQGMRIAMEAGGFSGSEADELRRAMGHKRSHARMAALAERLVAGLVAHGLDETAARRVLAQLSAFADYGFPESHAASFARLAWASAWLKCRHPAAFLCALLNSQPMGFYAPAVLVSDAQRHGVVVRGVDVTRSEWECSLEPLDVGSDARSGNSAPVAGTGAESDVPDTAWVAGSCEGSASADGVRELSSAQSRARYAVRLGLVTVTGLGPAYAPGVQAGLASRAERGPFVSPEDFARRTGLQAQHLEHLARLGALTAFEARRRQALWHVQPLVRRVTGLLAGADSTEAAVVLPAQSVAERVSENYALCGISAECHPLELLRAALHAAGVSRAADLREARGQSEQRGRGGRGGHVAVAGLVICRQRPPTAGGVTFVTLEDESGFVNLVVRPDVAARDRAALMSPLLVAHGRVQRADGVINVQVEGLQPLGDGTLPAPGSHDWR